MLPARDVCCAIVLSAVGVYAQDAPVAADHFVPSRPETVSWGWYPIDKKPVVIVRSGDTVRIDTLSHAGATQDEDPATYLTKLGIPRDEILEDTLEFWASRDERPREGRGGHVITGQIGSFNPCPCVASDENNRMT